MVAITGVMTAEMQSPLERTQYNESTIATNPVVTTVEKRSGSYGWRTSGPNNFHGVPNSGSEIALSAWIMQIQPYHYSWIFSGMIKNPGSPTLARPSLAIQWRPDEHTLKLVADDTGPYTGSPNLVLRDECSSFIQNGVLYRGGTWVHIGLYAMRFPSPIVTFYVNGVAELSWVGNSGEWKETPEVWSICNSHYSGTSGWNYYVYFDDFHIYDATGMGDHIPEARRFIMALPDGIGGSTQWTPSAGNNYENVDEPIPPDGDTTYNETAAVGNKDLFTHAAVLDAGLPYDYVVKDEVLVQVEYRTVDDLEIADTTFEIVANDGVLESYAGSFTNTDYGEWYLVNGLFEGQPDASAWNLIDFNAMEFGVKSI